MQRLLGQRPSLKAEAARLTRHGVPAALSARLADHLERGAPREVYHANPRLWAERWALPERETLQTLVAALYEGLLTLHWEVRCPACGAADSQAHLADLHHEAACPACRNVFGARLDAEVRVTFSVHPRFRSLYTDANDPAFRAEVEARLGAVSGQTLLLLPEFRRLFPQERLLPDESLEVARVALVFTDLAGSTALYAQRGDPRAYHLVRLHFDELQAAAAAHAGTVIKTIGDAVMAAFETPAQALGAALEMQGRISALNTRERLEAEERLLLKVGAHCGPCLHVTLNDRPDYFGTTVNVAARVQGLAAGGETVVTDLVWEDPEAQAGQGARTAVRTRAAVKGVEGELTLYRVPG